MVTDQPATRRSDSVRKTAAPTPTPGLAPMSWLRAHMVELTLMGALLLAVAYFGYLGYGLLTPQTVAEKFSGAKALAYTARQLEYGPRITGKPAHTQMADWLIQELRTLGWDVVVQPFVTSGNVPARNIIAVRSADAANANAPVGILATRYDSRQFADSDPTPDNRGQPVPGAVGNASGVATLLELARTVDTAATRHSLCLAFLDAESNRGIAGWEAPYGGSQFVQALSREIPRCAQPRFAVVLDSVGSTDQQIYLERSSDPSLSAALWGTAAELGHGSHLIGELKWTAQDLAHGAFTDVGVPAAAVVDLDYAYRNTVDDTLDKVDAASLARLGETLKAWLERGAPFDQGP